MVPLYVINRCNKPFDECRALDNCFGLISPHQQSIPHSPIIKAPRVITKYGSTLYWCLQVYGSLTGGLGREAQAAYKHLASLLAAKRDSPYSTTMGWLRCSLSFALLRSSILCIRGTRSSARHVPRDLPVDLVSAEAQLSTRNL